MQPYHIKINNDVVIEVEVEDAPIKMHIILNGGGTENSVTLEYQGGTSHTGPAGRQRKAWARKVTKSFPAGVPPASATAADGTAISKKSITNGATTIEYIDPGGSGM